jgi:RimJ/RimL family protein N-acetyltransferase
MSKRLADLKLTGSRVRVRPIEPKDAPRGFALLFQRQEILDQLVYDGPQNEGEIVDRYSEWKRVGDDADDHLFAVDDLTDDAFVGTVSLRMKGHPFLGSVGFWIDPERWGRGLATDAIRLTTHLGFVHMGLGSVGAEVYQRNPASRRALEKVGYEETHQASAHSYGGCSGDTPRWVLTIQRRQFRAANPDWAPASERVELL